MRLAVTGQSGQIVTALSSIGEGSVTILPLARPQADLAQPSTVFPALKALQPDLVINAAAFTAVDLAEVEKPEAYAVNARGAEAVAQAAAKLGIPIIQLSTDYVFDGRKATPYVETDPTAPETFYGQTKLEGERLVRAATDDHVILRLAWIYSASGRNFLKTMLRLAETRGEIGVVDDQIGNPTYAADIAQGIVTIARTLLIRRGDPLARGVFHMTAVGEASWADFATAIFRGASARGARRADVRRITTQDYPTPARRPANSRLTCDKLARVHGMILPDWRDGLERCLTELLGDPRR